MKRKTVNMLLRSVIMSLCMGGVMSFVMTAVNAGFGEQFLLMWLRAFGVGITVSLPTGMIAGPFAAKTADRLTGTDRQ
ncbi:MAG: DUF2798 domain-containing protein [Fibrobacterota bacterium]